MLPDFLLPETTIREAGAGPALSVDSGVLLLTLGITRIVEQESLDISVWGSADGAEWGAKPLLAFPQKFYCGTYQILLDLAAAGGVKFVRAKWAVNRWGKGELKPLFDAYVFVQDASKSMAKSA